MSKPGKMAVVLVLVSAAVLFFVGITSRLAGSKQPPKLVLWAWERREDLRFLGSQPVGVAFLAGSIDLDQRPIVLPRSQPLQVAAGAAVTSVVRLQITPTTPVTFDGNYRNQVAKGILHLANPVPIAALQIDFDAVSSQREFYRQLLQDVRRQLPASIQLSITALGSWCTGDDWLRGLPIDEAVPMMFRMGPDRSAIERAVASDGDFREPLCRSSVGVSTDEPWPSISRGKRVYVFRPRAWDEPSFSQVKARLQP